MKPAVHGQWRGGADGLTRTELELGYYIGKQGQVVNKTGSFIRLTKEAAEALEKARETAVQTYKYSGMSAGGMGITAPVRGRENELRDAEANRKNAWAEYNGVVAKMIDAAREEQKTEVDRLEEQLKAFRDIEEYAQGTEAQTVVQKQIGIFEEKIKEAKAREAEQAGRPNCDPRHEAFRKR